MPDAKDQNCIFRVHDFKPFSNKRGKYFSSLKVLNSNNFSVGFPARVTVIVENPRKKIIGFKHYKYYYLFQQIKLLRIYDFESDNTDIPPIK